MNENEIHAGKDYIIKVGHNEVKVKVLNHTGHSWIVKTAGGKIMPIQMADRFVRQVAPASEVPLQTPATPADAEVPTTAEPQAPTAEVAAEPVTPSASTPVSVPTEPVMPQVATQVLPPVASTSAATEKKLSMLDAAAQVLKTAGHPMKINDILDAMQTTGIWTPGLGKTPDRTLIAGLGLEIRRRVKNRFHKTAPGTFEYAGGERHE